MASLGSLSQQPGVLPEAQPSSRRKLQSLIETLVVFGLIEAALWTWSRALQADIILATMAVVIAISLYRRDLWPRLGLGRPGLAGSLWIIPAAMAIAAVILGIGYGTGALHVLYTPRLFWVAIAGYALWAFQQQYLLQSFFYTRFESLLGNDWRAVLAAALLFSFCHIPNPILMATTFAMAVVFCLLFRHYRNIYALAVAHAMFGLSLSASVSENAIRHMRVGIGYLHYISR